MSISSQTQSLSLLADPDLHPHSYQHQSGVLLKWECSSGALQSCHRRARTREGRVRNKQHTTSGSEPHQAHPHLEEFTGSVFSLLNFVPKTYNSRRAAATLYPVWRFTQYSSKGIKGTLMLWSTAPHGVPSHKEPNTCHKTLCSNLQESGLGPGSARKLISSNHPLVPLLPPIRTVANQTEVKKF